MRTAALPTFRKLYRRINHSEPGYANGLHEGEYILQVHYSRYISKLYVKFWQIGKNKSYYMTFK